MHAMTTTASMVRMEGSLPFDKICTIPRPPATISADVRLASRWGIILLNYLTRRYQHFTEHKSQCGHT